MSHTCALATWHAGALLPRAMNRCCCAGAPLAQPPPQALLLHLLHRHRRHALHHHQPLVPVYAPCAACLNARTGTSNPASKNGRSVACGSGPCTPRGATATPARSVSMSAMVKPLATAQVPQQHAHVSLAHEHVCLELAARHQLCGITCVGCPGASQQALAPWPANGYAIHNQREGLGRSER
jgi:hypothetical protein